MGVHGIGSRPLAGYRTERTTDGRRFDPSVNGSVIMVRKTTFPGLCAILGIGISLACSSPPARADVVTDWNTVFIDTIRAVGGPPCPIARAGAMLHVAMYDSLEAIDRRYTPLIVTDVNPPFNANRKAAIAAAAHRVLIHLYPARAAVFNAALTDSLAQIPDGPGQTNGVAVGIAVADKVIADHAGDDPALNDTNYVYQSTVGAYQPTFPDFTTPPFNPGWTHCKPWCMAASTQFRARRGPLGYAVIGNLLKSVRYATQYKEVMLYGKRTSTARTAEQTEIAWFWANDRNGTFKPSGQLNSFAQEISANNHLNLEQNARLFAMINVAMGDAGIVAWDQKFATDVDLWRPITAIRNADIDGNPLTKANKNWIPLLDFSPPFPGYVSGHATFAGAWAASMRAFFGTDRMEFDGTTDEPIVQGVVRHFTSFSQAARENMVSRIYLGVHFRCDVEDGFAHGFEMGELMASGFFRRTCRADLSRDGAVNAYDMTIFTSAYFNGDNAADFNNDGRIDAVDAIDFMNAYAEGCDG